jgi:predicted nucleic acid-binding protein
MAIGTSLSANPTPLATHVVVIGVDGLSPQGIHLTDTPNIDRLAKRGSHTWHARAVMPISSSPNWKSMISGAGPEQHGVTSNQWQLDNYTIEPTARGAGGLFPTIFSLLRDQRPNANIALFHDWKGLARLIETEACDIVVNPPGDKHTSNAAFATTASATEYFVANKPTFTFIHLDHVDHAGHQKTWLSEPYLFAVRETDQILGQIVAAIDQTGVSEDTLILLTSDHGGHGTQHGGEGMVELEIPWIIAGPDVKQDHEITALVDACDTAFLLKLYWSENGSDAVRTHASNIDVIVCSLHGKAELIAAAHRKFREGHATKVQIKALLEQIETDQQAGALHWLPISDHHLQRIATAFSKAPADLFLRAADALHLASATEERFPEIYSNDRHLLAAAPLFGLSGENVITG